MLSNISQYQHMIFVCFCIAYRNLGDSILVKQSKKTIEGDVSLAIRCPRNDGGS